MSFTSTVEQGSAQTVVSPSKRRRITLQDNPVHPQPTAQELWKWTLTSEAIAPCFVRDIFAMRDNVVKDADFFWLGRVPCRSVRVVGLVVGVQVYEKRIVYSVDDGTSVIDCVHRQAQPVASSAKRGLPKAHLTREPPVLLKPVAEVGSSVCVVGRVTRWHDSKQINVNHLEPCASPNDEPLHWRTVLALHKSSYSLPDPFIIPPATLTLHDISSYTLGKTQVQHVSEPQTPSSLSAGRSSPISSAVSSPAKSNTRSPSRLRHPSRLHSRDLTANTFRIYLKHYMDNAPAQPESHSTSWLVHANFGPDSCSESESDAVSQPLSRLPSTPTKRSRCSNDQTPKQLKFGANISDRTPRPIPRPVFVRGNDNARQHKGKGPALAGEEGPMSMTQGFTLSYLRRVPELADMAKRVVKAEAKRRAREERHRVKEQDQKVGRSMKEPPVSKGGLKEELEIGPKMKRLFRWAIVKLYEEGSIVIWDGPVRVCSKRACEGSTGLWKANSSTNTSYPDSTVFSSTTGLSRLEDDGDEGELSDPQPDEEAYISLNSAYLARHVEKAIGALMARATAANRAPLPGPTREQITTFLRRQDGRWARVGEWAVEDALEMLRTEGKVWGIGGGRWELCG